jgi:hypothetical protein
MLREAISKGEQRLPLPFDIHWKVNAECEGKMREDPRVILHSDFCILHSLPKELSGDHTLVATPVPFPNTAVKH